MSADELAQWLRDPASPLPSLDDMASVFGLCFDEAVDAHGAAVLLRLRFTLAVLRDTFPDDGGARRWLRAPVPEFGLRRPLDLLLSGRIEQLEELAVRAWNRRPASRWSADRGACAEPDGAEYGS